MRLLLLGILFCVPALASKAASAQALVGYVVSIEGDLSEAKLLRNSETGRRLRLGENILAGDTVTAPPTVKVRIETRSGMVDPCQPAPTAGLCRLHFQETTGGFPGAAIAGRISAMLSWFATPGRNLVTRAATPPTVSIGKGRAQKIVAGRRALRIAWNDGQPPFSVAVVNAGATVVSIRTPERDIRLPAAEFKPGAAQIVIEDAQARRVAVPLTVVSKGPAVPDFGAAAVNARHRALLELGTMAASDQGVWLLEALQGVDQLGPSEVASAFERALLSGSQP